MQEPRILTDADIDTLLEEAAERGAKRALRDVGLNDENAQSDLRELRGLLKSWKELRQEALKTVVKFLTTCLLAALMIGVGFKIGATKPGE